MPPASESQRTLEERYLRMLPQGSRGVSITDNPEKAEYWFREDGLVEWPHLILAEDTRTRGCTWHWVCSDWPYLDWLRDIGKMFIDRRISARRGRPLTSLEIISRTGAPAEFKHYFLKTDILDLESYTLIRLSPLIRPTNLLNNLEQ